MNVAGVVRGRLTLARAAFLTTSRGRARLRAGAASVAVGAAVAGLLAWALALAFAGLRDVGVAEPGARAVVAWLFTATLAGVLVFDLHQALAVLVAAPDLDLLRAAPLSGRALAALRLADALPASLALVLTLALPAAVGFAAAYGAPAAGPAAVLLALLALWLLPLGLGLALALPIARWLPAARARDLLGLLSTFALVGAWLANALLVPRAGLDRLHESGAGALALPAAPAWLPSAWAARALVTDGVDASVLAVLAAAAATGGALAWWSTRAHLDRALDRTHDAPRRFVASARVRVARSLTGAFLARDARLFGRQWSVAADVVAASLLWMLLPLLSVELVPAGRLDLARAMLLLLAVGIGYEVGARAFAFERSALAWVRVSPAGPFRWVLGRLAGVTLLAAMLTAASGLAVALGFRLPGAALPRLAEWTVAAGTLSIGLGLLTGALFADTSWSHPRAMLSAPGRLVGTGLLIAQSAGWLWLGAVGGGPPAGVLLLGAVVAGAGAVALAGWILGQREF